MANSDTRNSPKESRSLRDILGGVLFYFGIPAFTLYPLGFMALSLQLWRDPDFPYNWASSGLDFTIIWYAASLIPKIVVIGTGVRLLSISLLSTILIMSVAAITLHLLREWNVVKGWVKHEKQQNTVSGWKRLNKWERRFWLLSLAALLPLTVLLVTKMFPFDHLYDLPFYGGYFIFSAIGGAVLGYRVYKVLGSRQVAAPWIIASLCRGYFRCLKPLRARLAGSPLRGAQRVVELARKFA